VWRFVVSEFAVDISFRKWKSLALRIPQSGTQIFNGPDVRKLAQ
jgi:hypothetical protein